MKYKRILLKLSGEALMGERQYGIDPKILAEYAQEIKQECLTMYVNGMGFRAIERVKGIHNTTIMDWVKQVGELLPDYYDPELTPEVGELDELETFVGFKKTKSGCGQQ